MPREALEVADVFRHFGPTFRDPNGVSLSAAQRRAMIAIESCRTAALGGHVERCDDCGHQRVAYNSCLMGKFSNGELADDLVWVAASFWRLHSPLPSCLGTPTIKVVRRMERPIVWR